MKMWKSILATMLSAAMVIAFGVTGCGDDDEVVDTRCDEMCNRMDDCQEYFPGDIPPPPQCIEDCNANIGDETLCAFDECDTSATCSVYVQCITDCGVVPSP
jgi:hypothetical protein